MVDEHNDDTDHHQRTNTEENAQKVDTKDKHLMSTPTLKTDFQTYVNKRFIKECYLFHQLIMKKYNLTLHIIFAIILMRSCLVVLNEIFITIYIFVSIQIFG